MIKTSTVPNRLKKQGFTLIELLVVMTIIGVLSTLIINNLNDARARARDSKKKTELQQIKTALRLYYNDYQTFPANSGTTIAGCGSDHQTACTTTFATDTTTYMKSLPDYTYTYTQTDSGEGFTITVSLENASDEDSTTSQEACGISPLVDQNYTVCSD